MRTTSSVLVAMLGAMSLWPVAVKADGICSDFEDHTVQGWTAVAATVAVGSPGYGPSLCYLRCGDQVSPPNSAIIAPPIYNGDWRTAESVCFCIKVDNDGWPSSTVGVVSPFIIGSRSDSVGTGGIQARFVLDTPILEGDGWHCYTLPLHTISALPLPSSSEGHWQFSGTSVGLDATAWNQLLANVQVAWFQADIAGSSYQTEDFGVDGFCLSGCIPTGAKSKTWGSLKALYR